MDPSFYFDEDADPTFYFDADPNLTFNFDTTRSLFSLADPNQDPNIQFDADADPDPNFHIDAVSDPDPALHKSDSNLRPLVSPLPFPRFHCECPRPLMAPS